jgi:type 1 glutamine amidotransferase
MMRSILLVICLCAGLSATALAHETYKVLVFSKTKGFRHDSIPSGIAAIKKLAAEKHFSVDATEDSSLFTDANLSKYKVVIFLCTTGDVLDNAQQSALERFIRAGNGFVGVHSASDTEFTWPWYGGLVGAYFDSHPAIQTATIHIEDHTHPSTKSLPNPWKRRDEWYNFKTNPRTKVKVLARLDESSYTGGKHGSDHPIAWYHNYDGGRSWYTALGHTKESYTESEFLSHLAGGIEWAAGIPHEEILSFELNLSEGWNLISIPVEPLDSKIQTVLDSINGKYIAAYAYAGAGYKTYVPNSTANTLDTIEVAKGYWVLMNQSGILKVSGRAAGRTITLNKGWNLVGFNSLQPMSSGVALASIAGKFEAVYGYKNGYRGYYADSTGDLNVLEPGSGYWIYSKELTVWSLPNSLVAQDFGVPSTREKQERTTKL